jgi:P27 family predicted phage terminase small subunit
MANRKKPYIVREQSGNPGKRKEAEPWARPGTPQMPKGMPAEAKAHWKFLVMELDAKGAVSPVDAGIIEGACMAYAKAKAAEAVLERDGMTYTVQFFDQKAQEMRDMGQKDRPEVKHAKDAWTLYHKFMAELMATPKSRGGTVSKPLVDDLEAALDDAV